ncbi:nitroreductase family protein [uncultured Dubosiella sp.]|uniref:nitroreductase family protein n=1 Tax=uncultured Dubosiella sp. TaxID=1937011 RepID=UPI0025B4ABF1|nr:nitroreductase family protein [uncultured Dubosiella sp.]
MMTLEEAARLRHSVRSFTDEPIGAEDVAALQEAIAVVNEEDGLDIQLVLDEPKAFTSLKARFGRFSGARNYLALVGAAARPQQLLGRRHLPHGRPSPPR